MKWSMWQSVTRQRNLLRKSCASCQKTIWMHSLVCPTCENLHLEIENKRKELANDADLLSAEIDRIYEKYCKPLKEDDK